MEWVTSAKHTRAVFLSSFFFTPACTLHFGCPLRAILDGVVRGRGMHYPPHPFPLEGVETRTLGYTGIDEEEEERELKQIVGIGGEKRVMK